MITLLTTAIAWAIALTLTAAMLAAAAWIFGHHVEPRLPLAGVDCYGDDDDLLEYYNTDDIELARRLDKLGYPPATRL